MFTSCDKNYSVVVANVENCQKIHELKGNVKSIKAIAWSPEHCVLATGNDHLLLWVPDYIRLR
jgi:WD40 repeat protein